MSGQARSLIACLLVALTGWASAAEPVAAVPMVGPARCRFAVPDELTAADVRWSGACRGGFAQGRGTVRAFEGGRVVRTFLGRYESGWPAIGAIAVDGGFKAGRFEGSRLVADGDREVLIRAFEEAAAAARQLAAGYARAGNTASARHYREQARRLAQQLD